MFSNKRQLQKRTPDNGTDREEFLSLLVDEYLNSVSYDAKCQVLANLANFAYDPVNYSYIRDVGVLDVFLHVLKNESTETLLNFASAGICNLCLDPLNAKYIQDHKGLDALLALLKVNNTETILNVITTLIYLFQDQTINEQISTDLIHTIKEVGKTEDKRLSNLTTIFLQDVCGIH